MAWNGSNNVGAASCRTNRARQDASPTKRSARRGLLSVVLLLALASVALWWFLGRDEARPSPEAPSMPHETRAIAAVTPQIVTNKVVQTNSEIVNNIATNKKRKVGTYIDKRGVKRYLSGARVNELKHGINVELKDDSPARVFKCAAEKHIYGLISAEPGDVMFGERNFETPRARRDLQEALINKIEFDSKDTPEERKAKEDVIAVKKELQAALRRGEDPSKILQESYDECQRLSQYRQNLEKQVREISRNKEMSGEDVEDYLTAANQMLEKKGIAPLKLNCVSKRALQLRLKKENHK